MKSFRPVLPQVSFQAKVLLTLRLALSIVPGSEFLVKYVRVFWLFYDRTHFKWQRRGYGHEIKAKTAQPTRTPHEHAV